MLSPYEQKALAEVEARKGRSVAKSPRRLVPEKLQDVASDAGEQAKRLPGAEHAGRAAAKGYEAAAKGIGKFMTRTSQFTLSTDRVLTTYRREGQDVEEVASIRALDLQAVDRIAKFKRLNHLYAGTAMLEGAGAAAVMTGGQLLAAGGGLAGAGAGASPGLGVVAGAVAGDAAAVLVAASRVVAHTALYYGYDPDDPREEVFMMSVIGLGASATQGAKMAAYGELARLTQLLARNAPWAKLNQHVLTNISTRFAAQFGAKLTKKKLGQFIPVAGIVIGGGMNYATIDRTADAAYWTYRERFLRDKLGESMSVPTQPAPESDEAPGMVEERIDVLELLEDQGIDMSGTEAYHVDSGEHG